MSTLKADNITGSTGTTITVPAGQTITCSGTATGFSKIVDIKQALKTDQWTYSTVDTWVDITGLSITHACANASNKLLLSYSLSVGARFGGYNMSIRLMDDATVCAQGDADGSVIRATNGYWGTYYGENQGTLANQILYTPGNTDSNAYHIEAYTHYAQGIYVNRTFNWNNAHDEYASTVSTLTLMEIAA